MEDEWVRLDEKRGRMDGIGMNGIKEGCGK